MFFHLQKWICFSILPAVIRAYPLIKFWQKFQSFIRASPCIRDVRVDLMCQPRRCLYFTIHKCTITKSLVRWGIYRKKLSCFLLRKSILNFKTSNLKVEKHQMYMKYCFVGIGQMKAEFWPEILIWKAALFFFFLLFAFFDNNVQYFTDLVQDS